MEGREGESPGRKQRVSKGSRKERAWRFGMFDKLGILGKCEGCSWFHCGLGGQGSRGSESWQGASPPDCTAAGRSALCLEGVGAPEARPRELTPSPREAGREVG